MAKADLSPETLKARFHELGQKRDAILAVATPLREERDSIVATNREKEEALNVQVRDAETGLFDIDMERGQIARYLEGKTGEPPRA